LRHGGVFRQGLAGRKDVHRRDARQPLKQRIQIRGADRSPAFVVQAVEVENQPPRGPGEKTLDRVVQRRLAVLRPVAAAGELDLLGVRPPIDRVALVRKALTCVGSQASNSGVDRL